jgi:hypothetical protein
MVRSILFCLRDFVKGFYDTLLHVKFHKATQVAFSHKNTEISSLCFTGDFASLSKTIHQWWQDAESPFRFCVLSDSLMVERILLESSVFIGLTGNESPAGRRKKLKHWQANPSSKGIIRSADLSWINQSHPDLLQSLAYATPSSSLQKESTQKIRIHPLPFQWKNPFTISTQVPEASDERLHVHIYVLGGIPLFQRPRFTPSIKQAVLFQENATLEHLFKLEESLFHEQLNFLLCDTTILGTLRFPTTSLQGRAIHYSLLYESTKGALAWQAVANSLNMHRFTHHPHEWWRWG